MRKVVAYIVLLLFCAVNLLAQKPIIEPVYDFLGPLHYKNGKATVIVKAMYTGAARSGEYYFFKKLEKKKILKSKKYFRLDKIEGEGYMDAGSSITFVPENCKQQYIATIAQKINFELYKGGQTIYLTCTVFQNIFPDKKRPFYVIDDVTYKKEDIPTQQNFAPLVYLDPDNLARDIGTSYFSDSGENTMSLKCLMVIAPNQLAIVETADHIKHHFTYVNRVPTKSGYVDFYKNNTESFELNIDRIIHTYEKSSIRLGRMTIDIDHTKTSFNVYGEVEDADRYNTLKY